MKKIVLFLLIALMGVSAGAQSVVSPGDRHMAYCNVMGYNFWGVGKVKVQLDMGKYADTRGFDSLYGEDGKKLKFNTIMGALNYMGERGWRCVGTYYITKGSGNVVHYLMEKSVASDAEVTEGLILREDLEPVEKEKHKRGEGSDDMY